MEQETSPLISGPLHQATYEVLVAKQAHLRALVGHDHPLEPADDPTSAQHLLWMVDQCLTVPMTIDKEETGMF